MTTTATLQSSNYGINYYRVVGDIGDFLAMTYPDNDYIHIENKQGKKVPAKLKREILPIVQAAIQAGRA